VRKNVAGQKIGAQLIAAADGTAFTGSVTVAVTVDAGTQATGSVGSGACTHEGNGYHTYAPAQAETNGDLVAFTFTGTGAIPVTVQVYTRLDDVSDGAVPLFGIIDQGTAQSASSTGLVLRSEAAFANDTLIGATLAAFGSTQGYWQTRVITDNALSGDSVTVDAWTVTPSGTITYKIFGTPPASATALPAVNLVQVAGSTTDVSALATNVAAILVDTGTTLDGKINVIDGIVDDILVDTAVIGAAGAGLTALATQASVNTIDGIVDAILVDTAEIGAAGAGLTALATAANLATVDTVVDAIKVKTDSLTFTVAGQVDANIQAVNDVALVGDGSATPWGPA
jgi:hypothetical protein